MKKTLLSICLMGLLTEGAFAGAMGDVAVAKKGFVPFVMGEAAVTWNSTNSVTIFGNPPSLSKQLWGGRGAVGLTHAGSNRIGYSAELGWGYYGSTTSSNSGSFRTRSASITNDSYLYGMDLLAGISYDFAPIQVFFKAGGMAENRHTKGTAVFVNGSQQGTNNINMLSTNVLPEIKVGGLYAFNEHVSFSLAYMHVFGNNNFSASVDGTATGASASNISSTTNGAIPALNSLLFGLVYNFA